MSIAGISSIVFDAAGTLIRPAHPVAETYHRFGDKFGSRRRQPEIAERFQYAWRRLFAVTSDDWRNQSLPSSELIERDHWQKLVEFVFDDVQHPLPLFQQLWNFYARPSAWALYPDVDSCMARLSQSKIQLVIGSNFDDRLKKICQEFDCLSKLEVFCSSEIGYRKPDLNFYRAIQSTLSVESRTVLMVGNDRINDFEAPSELGWNALLLDRQTPEPNDSTIDSLSTLAGRIAE